MIRLGLCCIFKEQPIRFRQVTAASLGKVERHEQLKKLSAICLHNVDALLQALQWLRGHDITVFRVLSPLFPRFTHPEVGYALEDLVDCAKILAQCARIKQFGLSRGMRLSLHPDQFNVLSSPHGHVVQNTLRELEYHGLVAELIGAEVITLHGGGVYGDKGAALQRFATTVEKLSTGVRSRLAVENDDRSYTPADLLPLCRDLELGFVYDVHHHRCLPDSLTIAAATEACVRLWQNKGGLPYFHISSPRQGWQAANSRSHADYIDINDFPECWRGATATVDVEAKAKELAVLQLQRELGKW